jgi:hypothetical protein
MLSVSADGETVANTWARVGWAGHGADIFLRTVSILQVTHRYCFFSCCDSSVYFSWCAVIASSVVCCCTQGPYWSYLLSTPGATGNHSYITATDRTTYIAIGRLTCSCGNTLSATVEAGLCAFTFCNTACTPSINPFGQHTIYTWHTYQSPLRRRCLQHLHKALDCHSGNYNTIFAQC